MVLDEKRGLSFFHFHYRQKYLFFDIFTLPCYHFVMAIFMAAVSLGANSAFNDKCFPIVKAKEFDGATEKFSRN